MQATTKPWNALVPLLWAALLFTGIYYEFEAYQQAGDEAVQKALSLPEWVEAVLADTDELAWKLTDQPELEWGEDYQAYLQALEEQYSR